MVSGDVNEQQDSGDRGCRSQTGTRVTILSRGFDNDPQNRRGVHRKLVRRFPGYGRGLLRLICADTSTVPCSLLSSLKEKVPRCLDTVDIVHAEDKNLPSILDRIRAGPESAEMGGGGEWCVEDKNTMATRRQNKSPGRVAPMSHPIGLLSAPTTAPAQRSFFLCIQHQYSTVTSGFRQHLGYGLGSRPCTRLTLPPLNAAHSQS